MTDGGLVDLLVFPPVLWSGVRRGPVWPGVARCGPVYAVARRGPVYAVARCTVWPGVRPGVRRGPVYGVARCTVWLYSSRPIPPQKGLCCIIFHQEEHF